MSVVLTLGNIRFSYSEIPSHIPFGGAQMLAVKQLVGGERYVQSLGPSEGPIGWSGIFLGSTAEARANYLNRMRQEGKQLTLTWSQQRYLVVIRHFRATFMQTYRIPYAISCEVVEDETRRVESVPANTMDQQIRLDALTATNLVSNIPDTAPLTAASPSTLQTLMSGLNTAISTVSDFAKATTSEINSVLTPLADVTARTKLLIATVGATAQNVSTLGGILPGNTISQGLAHITSQVSAQESLPQLYGLNSALGRMNGNIGMLGSSSGHSITVYGGNLQSLAAQYYGDPTQWTKIAAANDLYDPQLSGQQTLTIPP